MTANTMADQVRAYLDAGMDSVAPKPIQVETLMDSIKAVLAAETQP